MPTVIDYGWGASRDFTLFTASTDSRFRVIGSSQGLRREVRSISASWKESAPITLVHGAQTLVVVKMRIPPDPAGTAVNNFAALVADALGTNDWSGVVKTGAIILVNEPMYLFVQPKYEYAEGELVCENNEYLFIGLQNLIDYGTAAIVAQTGFSFLSVTGRDILTEAQQKFKFR